MRRPAALAAIAAALLALALAPRAGAQAYPACSALQLAAYKDYAASNGAPCAEADLIQVPSGCATAPAFDPRTGVTPATYARSAFGTCNNKTRTHCGGASGSTQCVHIRAWCTSTVYKTLDFASEVTSAGVAWANKSTLTNCCCRGMTCAVATRGKTLIKVPAAGSAELQTDPWKVYGVASLAAKAGEPGNGSFQAAAKAWVDALTAAKANVTVLAAYRPPVATFVAHVAYCLKSGCPNTTLCKDTCKTAKYCPSCPDTFRPSFDQEVLDALRYKMQKVFPKATNWTDAMYAQARDYMTNRTFLVCNATNPDEVSKSATMSNALAVSDALRIGNTVEAALDSAHLFKGAIDLKIEWARNITIARGPKNCTAAALATACKASLCTIPRGNASDSSSIEALRAVGCTYGAVHYSPVSNAPGHWSADGK